MSPSTPYPESGGNDIPATAPSSKGVAVCTGLALGTTVVTASLTWERQWPVGLKPEDLGRDSTCGTY